MKTKEKKQEDLNALTEQFKNSKSAMVLSFNGLTVDKDQAFRNELRETGAKYQVVKNTLARLAVKGTAFEEATEHFTGVTSVAWTDNEPVDLSKVISKYLKEEKDIFEFKTGIVEGKVISFDDVNAIATLPSKEELIAKLLYLLNAPAQRLATVLNAVPRDLAIVVKQISEKAEDAAPKAEAKEEAPKEEAPAAEEKKETAPVPEEKPAEAAAEKEEPKADAKTEEPKTEEPKTEEPKTEEPKAEEPKTEEPKDEASDEKAKEKKDEPEADSKDGGDEKPAEESEKSEA